MRDFAIILDEEDEIRVIASKWLTTDKKSMFWPPFKKASEVTEAIIQLRDVGKNWKTYPITKIIKFNDSYTDAVRESKQHGIEHLTDPSDDEKLKRSRSIRYKKNRESSPVEPKKKKAKTVTKDTDDESSNSEAGDLTKKDDSPIHSDGKKSSDDEPIEEDPLLLPPVTLNVQLQDVFQNVEKSAKGHVEKPANSSGDQNKERSGIQSGNTSKAHSPNRESANAKFDKPPSAKSRAEKNTQASTSKSNDQENDAPLPDVSHLTDHEIIIATHQMVFKLMNKVNRLQRQNDALKRKLEGGYRNTRSTDKQLSLQDIAVINKYFPIDTNEANKNKKIDVVENMLGKKDQEFFQNALLGWAEKKSRRSMVIFFKSKGGSDCRKLIFNCMIAAITNEVANQYSFTGRKAPRKSFKDLRLCTCLYQAVKLAFPNADDNDIKEGISAWLDTANTRLKREASGKGPKRAPFQPIVIDETLNSGEESDP